MYAPTSESSEEDFDDFYRKLELNLVEVSSKNVKLVAGDLNAKMGSDNTSGERINIKHGYGKQNERGDTLLQLH